MSEQRPDVDRAVAQQSIHLLDRVLGLQPGALRQPEADRVNRQGRGMHDSEDGVGHRENALGVHVLAAHHFDQSRNLTTIQGVLVHGHLR